MAKHQFNQWVLSQQQTVRQKLNGYFRSERDRLNRRYLIQRHRFNRWYVDFSLPFEQRLYGLVGLYICLTPGLLSLLEFLEASYTSKPSKCK